MAKGAEKVFSVCWAQLDAGEIDEGQYFRLVHRLSTVSNLGNAVRVGSKLEVDGIEESDNTVEHDEAAADHRQPTRAKLCPRLAVMLSPPAVDHEPCCRRNQREKYQVRDQRDNLKIGKGECGHESERYEKRIRGSTRV